MRFPDWFGSVHYLFKKNNRKFLQRRRSEFLQKGPSTSRDVGAEKTSRF